ncbi:DUF1573 domain-containing protein [Tenacibaculum finnmarkense]|uniref:DUF1573 domain-containing protein n=1 Tax=Tenacibaculum finnmarkense TaxID=2781243 RepID=UPI00187B3CCA|nr:DUF1573 domain-containing protein [Tenacibaculum finnmarkense]MBE7692241.1 DUF1573 domain-containing protein [Tenacibaculum finnmarkense genomovar finnmarkense]MCG8805108.1 DUF1573 domain-containing protein [Tenacibaculum finnmarkense]MCG8855463.1 DUF1573 domain-containing protein [Tenacibaculum finnmarkense]
MKTILSFIAICFITITINAQEFKFVAESIDYGKITQGSEKNRVFEFINIGDAPLIIKQVISTCGCAVPKKPENPIMPGEKGKIAVSYDTNRIGGFSKMFTIVSNAKTTSKRIKIKGHVSAKNTLASK